MKKSAALLLGLSVLACGDAPEGESAGGMSVDLTLEGRSDVAGFRITVTPVSCESGAPTAGDVTIQDVSLEPITLAGAVAPAGDAGLTTSGRHTFSEVFVALLGGCYDVSAQAIDVQGAMSSSCASAALRGVNVLDGKTTEVVLVSQCDPMGVGAVDIIAALNGTPQLLGLTYEPSKFVPTCTTQTLCAIAQDPDSDPLEIVWTNLGQPLLVGPTAPVRSEREDGATVECIDVVAGPAGDYLMRVDVYDLTPAGRRIEEWIASEGGERVSHDTLEFPLYSRATETGIDCTPQDGGAGGEGGTDGKDGLGQAQNVGGAAATVIGGTESGSEQAGSPVPEPAASPSKDESGSPDGGCRLSAGGRARSGGAGAFWLLVALTIGWSLRRKSA